MEDGRDEAMSDAVRGTGYACNTGSDDGDSRSVKAGFGSWGIWR